MPPTLESTVYSSRGMLNPVVTTEAEYMTPALNQKNREGWQRLIVKTLVEWRANPEYFDEEEFEAPKPEIILLALRFTQQLRDAEEPPPHRIIPDGDGGIVIERRHGHVSHKLHFGDDGTAELIVMNRTQVIDRTQLQ